MQAASWQSLTRACLDVKSPSLPSSVYQFVTAARGEGQQVWVGEENLLELRVTFWVDCKEIWERNLLSNTRWAEKILIFKNINNKNNKNPNRLCHHFLTGICEGRSHSYYLLGRKQNTSLCSLVYCCHLSSPLTDSSFLLSCYSCCHLGKAAMLPIPWRPWEAGWEVIWSQWESTQKERNGL